MIWAWFNMLLAGVDRIVAWSGHHLADLLRYGGSDWGIVGAMLWGWFENEYGMSPVLFPINIGYFTVQQCISSKIMISFITFSQHN